MAFLYIKCLKVWMINKNPSSVIKNVCNKAANALTTEALSSISDEVWLEDCPASIISLVQFDYSQ